MAISLAVGRRTLLHTEPGRLNLFHLTSLQHRKHPCLSSARLTEYVSACFTGLWIESHEHDDAITEIAQLCRQERDWRLATWDVSQGRCDCSGSRNTVETGTNDPLAAVRALSSFPPSEQPTLLVLVNFHRFVQSAEVVQTLARQIQLGKQNRTFVVILSPIVQIPTELEKQFVVIEHDLPTRREQLGRDRLAASQPKLPS